MSYYEELTSWILFIYTIDFFSYNYNFIQFILYKKNDSTQTQGNLDCTFTMSPNSMAFTNKVNKSLNRSIYLDLLGRVKLRER